MKIPTLPLVITGLAAATLLAVAQSNNQDFDAATVGKLPPGWSGSQAGVVKEGSNQYLLLTATPTPETPFVPPAKPSETPGKPYFAVFTPARPIDRPAKIAYRIRITQAGSNEASCYLFNNGLILARVFVSNSRLRATDGDFVGGDEVKIISQLQQNKWYSVMLSVDPAQRKFSVSLDGRQMAQNLKFATGPADRSAITRLLFNVDVDDLKISQ